MRKFNTFVLLAVSFLVSLPPQAQAFDLVTMMCDQGQAAIKEGRYGDAVGFFNRAKMICVGSERREAGIWEMIAYASWKAGQLDEAHKACVQAYAGYEHTLGSMNPRSIQVLDLWAAVQQDRGDLPMAMATLRRALEYSEGVWSNRYDDVERVPHRLERIAELAKLQGSAGSMQGEYASAIAQLEQAAAKCSDFGQRTKIEKVVAQLKASIAGKSESSSSLTASASDARPGAFSQPSGLFLRGSAVPLGAEPPIFRPKSPF